MARGDFPSAKQDQFVLRFPDGLRDRIKTYAEAHGRSMNAEIIRVLEREFPEPQDIADRVNELMEMMKAIRRGTEHDGNVEKISALIEETIEGVISGRIRGVDEQARSTIETKWGERLHERSEDNAFNYSLDPEEHEALQRSGTTEKYVWPDGEIGPKEPQKRASVEPNDSDDPEFHG